MIFSRKKLLPIIFLLFSGVLYVRAFMPQPPIYDEAFYQALATSLRQGQGYHAVWSPEGGRPRFPPGYPLFLSGILAATTSPKIPYTASVLLSLGSLIILFHLFQKTSTGTMVAALFGTHAMTVAYSGKMMSEPFYILLTYTAILFALISHKTGKRSYFSVGFLLALLSAFTRTIGWILPVCFLINRLRRSDYRGFFIFSLLAGGVFFYFLRLTRTGEYIGLWSPWAQGTRFAVQFLENASVHFGRNMADYISGSWASDITRSTAPAPLFAGKLFLSVLLSLIVLRGWWTSLRASNFCLPEYFYAAYTVVCLGWEIYKFDNRLFLPILPLTLYYLVEAILSVKGKERPVLLFLSALLILYVGRDVLYPPKPNDDSSANFIAACRWLQAETPTGAVIYSYAPAGIYLHAQRQSLKPSEWPQEWRDWQSRPQYFLSDERFQDENRRFTGKAPLSEPLFTTGDGRMRIYGIPLSVRGKL